MKKFTIALMFALLPLVSFAACTVPTGLPTNGLVMALDMVSISAGTMSDCSGNGNNGTLHGTTQTAQGTTFNGTSDWITVPALISNSDFTAIVIMQPASSGSSLNTIWEETSDNVETQMIRMVAYSGQATVCISGGCSSVSLPSLPHRYPNFDVFSFSRSARQLQFSMLSRPNATGIGVLPDTSSATTLYAGIGAGNLNGTQWRYFTGQMAYFVLYNRQLSVNEQKAAYASMATAVYSRPVFLNPLPPSIQQAGSVWQRQGNVLNWTPSGSSSPVGEPDVIYDTNPQLITGVTSVFKMVASEDNSVANEGKVYYFESTDGQSWVKNLTPIIVGGCRASFLKVNSTYSIYVVNNGSGGCPPTSGTSQIDLWTSSNGMTGWTKANSNVMPAGISSAWDYNLQNPHVYYNSSLTPSWYMLYEGGAAVGGATSPDGVTWTKLTVNPIMGVPVAGALTVDQVSGGCCGGPWFSYQNGAWWVWVGQTTINRYMSPTFNDNWIWSQPHASLSNNSGNESNQAADPTLVEANGQTYMFYGVTDPIYSGIKLVIAPMPLSQLVTTPEGTTSDSP